jgi:hypothetical protein
MTRKRECTVLYCNSSPQFAFPLNGFVCGEAPLAMQRHSRYLPLRTLPRRVSSVFTMTRRLAVCRQDESPAPRRVPVTKTAAPVSVVQNFERRKKAQYKSTVLAGIGVFLKFGNQKNHNIFHEDSVIM